MPSLAQARGRGGFAPYGSVVASASQFDVATQPNLRFHFPGVVICIVIHPQHRGVVVCVDVCIVICIVLSVVVVCVVTRCLLMKLLSLLWHCCLRRGVIVAVLPIVCVAVSLSASRHCCQRRGIVVSIAALCSALLSLV